ncbi:hypothetical protein PFISCL1PPCAC_17427, partial [Pristionchus fissidentatus]
ALRVRQTLVFARGERIQKGTTPVQAADGTIFLVRGDESPLTVSFNGQSMSARKSWEGNLIECAHFGDSLYFLTSVGKLYKATFLPPGGVRVDFVRNHAEGEAQEFGMVLSRSINGQKLVYRACDTVSDGITVDDEIEEEVECSLLVSIKNRKLIYAEPGRETSVGDVASNAILVTFTENMGEANLYDTYTVDDAPFVYLLTGVNQMVVVNTDTNQFQSIDLSCGSESVSFYRIVGVHNGVITLKGKSTDENYYFFTADMPENARKSCSVM